MPPPRIARRPRRWWRWLAGVTVLGMVVAGGGAGYAWWYYRQVCVDPCADLSVFHPFTPYQSSIVYDRAGEEIGRFFVEDRRVSKLTEMPSYVPGAFLAIEDARFYQHGGVDWRRVVGAAVANLRVRGTSQGASTVTMQLARNVFPDLLPARERTFDRKLREVHVARAIERSLPKSVILQHYLNTIYLGAGAYGVDAAARAYFGHAVADVTLAEAALLAGLPQRPSAANPFRRPEAARARRNVVLDRMLALGMVTAAARDSARAEPLVLAADPSSEAGLASLARAGPYFVEAIRRDLQAILGPTLYRGGYRIHTTLDAAFQRVAEATLAEAMVGIESGALGAIPSPIRGAATGTRPQNASETPYLQAGFAALDVDSGDVRVLIGGRSFAESSFNRMTQAWRQPGSAFKPFIYAAALEAGRQPTDLISDGPIAVPRPGGIVWRPQNFNPREVNGSVTLETALARSLNRASVRLGMEVGVSRVLRSAEAMGLTTPMPRVPAVLLGSADVHPLDLIAAYGPLARADGHRLTPRLITRVEDRSGVVVVSRPAVTTPGIAPGVAAALRAMLTRTVDGPRGTAGSVRRNGYQGPVAGKTGTTNGTTNTWFIGVTPDFVSGVWVGFDRPRAILPDSAATGGRVAAPIWARIMMRAPTMRDTWPEPLPLDSLPSGLEATLAESVPPPQRPPSPTDSAPQVRPDRP